MSTIAPRAAANTSSRWYKRMVQTDPDSLIALLALFSALATSTSEIMSHVDAMRAPARTAPVEVSSVPRLACMMKGALTLVSTHACTAEPYSAT